MFMIQSAPQFYLEDVINPGPLNLEWRVSEYCLYYIVRQECQEKHHLKKSFSWIFLLGKIGKWVRHSYCFCEISVLKNPVA